MQSGVLIMRYSCISEEEKRQRQKDNAEIFEMWKKQKDVELKEKKKNEELLKKAQEEEKKRKKLSKIHGITIGPYTGAGELREIQKLIEEKQFENEEEGGDEEEGEEEEVGEEEGGEEEGGEEEGREDGGEEEEIEQNAN